MRKTWLIAVPVAVLGLSALKIKGLSPEDGSCVPQLADGETLPAGMARRTLDQVPVSFVVPDGFVKTGLLPADSFKDPKHGYYVFAMRKPMDGEAAYAKELAISQERGDEIVAKDVPMAIAGCPAKALEYEMTIGIEHHQLRVVVGTGKEAWIVGASYPPETDQATVAMLRKAVESAVPLTDGAKR